MDEKFQFILRLALERWLQGIDLRHYSETFGVCDRNFWAWKTQDFANGSMQGGLAGFLDCYQQLGLSDKEVRFITNAVIVGSQKIQRSNGSFEEAYPLESSYAVTGFVTFYLVYSLKKYPHFFDGPTTQLTRKVIENGLKFLEKTPETHGYIANHIATASLCFWLWNNDVHPVNRLLEGIDKEGWFNEYDGADPGYQSLLLHYFALASSVQPLAENWTEPLSKAAQFVEEFAMPDGSFAGEIGSRGTAIFYLASSRFVGLDQDWWSRGVTDQVLINPVTVDGGNFVPVFTSWAYVHKHSDGFIKKNYNESVAGQNYFENAGLFVFKNQGAKLVFSRKNGVIRKTVRNAGGWHDESLVGFYNSGKSTQTPVNNVAISSEEVSFRYNFLTYKEKYPNIYTGILLRIFSLVTFLVPALQRGLKNFLRAFVMGKSFQANNSGISVAIDLTSPDLNISVNGTGEWRDLKYGYYGHMASANSFDKRSLHNETTLLS